ncbi:MAG: choice-of-anchor L domain-containing protein [Candidatus Thermoplasmatota archaeon]|nr:choice-of-anchor L domain-containing protein [Candidatus Thermoplasmatota archaeon]
MNKKNQKKISGGFIGIIVVFTCITGILSSEAIKANPAFAEELALAILTDPSCLISTSYTDTDGSNNRQAIILSSLGTMSPTNEDSFILLSTGIAGAEIATTNIENPGSERGTWFQGGQYPRNRWPYIYDRATLSMTLLVPDNMNFVYYDVQFFSTEYPEYVGSVYNDKFTGTVTSPSKGSSSYVIDINTGHFVLNSHDIPGTGFDVFSTSGNPSNVDMVDTTPRTPGADAGATALHTAGGHEVSPNEQITITFEIQDVYDNQFDSTVFIDNLRFAEHARPVIEARKEVENLNEGYAKTEDVLKYTITVSNIGIIDQTNNPGNEIEDKIPESTSYVAGSSTATSGTVSYDSTTDTIVWNGDIAGESSVVITFKVQVEDFGNKSQISNQAEVNWDKNNDGTNDELLLTNWANISTYFEAPSYVTEDFSDDLPGNPASESYFDRGWFSTDHSVVGSNFEVSAAFEYLTPNSFKTKIRADGSPLYWNYYLDSLLSDITAWEIWVYFGKTCEYSNVLLDFKNGDQSTIAMINLDYVEIGEPPLSWIPRIDCWNGTEWLTLGYGLDDGWYKLRIERNETNIDYLLYESGQEDPSKESGSFSQPFKDLSKIEWSSSYDAIVCPMFFWDDHTVYLEPLS